MKFKTFCCWLNESERAESCLRSCIELWFNSLIIDEDESVWFSLFIELRGHCQCVRILLFVVFRYVEFVRFALVALLVVRGGNHLLIHSINIFVFFEMDFSSINYHRRFSYSYIILDKFLPLWIVNHLVNSFSTRCTCEFRL